MENILKGKKFDKGLFLVNVLGIIFDIKTKKILIGRRENDPNLKNLTWCFPGGRPDYGEGLEEGLIRQIKIKTKHTKDLSLGMFITLSMGIFLWIIYAFLTKDVPLVIANIVTITIILYILILKIKYK